MSAEKRTAEANRAARGYALRLKNERGYMIVNVTGLTKDQALEVRKRFQAEGWPASCKNGYSEVRAERKI
jgi:hypothetical protein